MSVIRPKATYNMTAMYKVYKKNFTPVCNVTIFTNIIEDFYTAVLNEIIENEFEYKLPYDLGNLYIKKRDAKFRFDGKGNVVRPGVIQGVDWAKTMQMWKDYPETKTAKQVVYNENTHTDGFKYKFFWNRCGAEHGVKGMKLYCFKPNRTTAKKKLGEVLKTGKVNNYYL